ncbi:tetratricopeptide repeat protein [Actinomadura sp. WMMB 499]|uniref:tetratricopeptide repeat protein n=1 Tax=Actinomadura sp. WMMB 499 TaxID=1219491 RepID=UPI001247F47F|nr:tetratricopeptide repeat protein [Actinomadura sp. WMMB 499]QFG23640.1 tetratricopeptide repeat protein [Actinomadura sp. WMMB 499]
MMYEDFQRARNYFDAKDYATAARLLAPIVADVPGDRAAVELLARAYFHSAQLAPAERTLRRLVELDPSDGWAHEALARTLERQSRHAEARPFRALADAMGVTPAAQVDVSLTAADLA